MIPLFLETRGGIDAGSLQAPFVSVLVDLLQKCAPAVPSCPAVLSDEKDVS